ncbi:transcription termination factor 1 [Pseudonaja textilis]|uniref:transcription termination factor 1 n=1 Tax=Pseudonaja textilis TaxID=8673 RepID=UPI000EA9A905|nr:transcription termination factor 1 [Pseudonaja textilis]
MMNEADILLVEDTQQPSYEKKTKKSRKRSREEVEQPVVSSDQTPSQDTEDAGTSRKKHKKKKSSLETSDASWVIPETPLSDESEINKFVPKKKKTKMKHRLKQGSDEEGWSPSIPNQSSQPSLKKALANRGVDDDEFWSSSTPNKSSKLSQKEDLGNVSVVDGNRSSHKKKKKKKKKKRKRREGSYDPGELEKEKAEATSSQRDDQVDLDQTIDTQMDLFGSSPFSFSEGPQVDLHPGDGQERSCSPTAEDSEATQVDLEVEGTSAEDHEQTQPQPKLPTSGVNTKLDQSQTGRKLRSSRKRSPPETYSEEEEEEDVYALDREQLENARKELEEFIPRAKTMADSAIRQLAKRDLARFRELKKKGLAVRFGVFSQAENNLLTENIEAFLEESGIETAEKLLFSNRFPEEEAEIKRLKCKYLFCERIARGIARPWRLVYYRARKMFDPQNYKGRYTEKEKKNLFKYHAMYGNRWKKISELMNRSSHSIALKYSQMVEDSNLGPWTKDETYRLLQTVRDILKAKVKGLDSALDNRDSNGALTLLRENLYKNIGWMKVAAQVETRSWRQCKRKWMSILTKKMMGKSHFHGLNNLQFKIDLIERLYELNVADTSEIDWEHIAGVIGNAPPDYVQSRFYIIKTTYVPFWYEKTFPEIIDYLFEETLPTLKETYERLAQRQGAPPVERSCKTSFRFNDIFRDMLEDELINDEDLSDEESGEPSQASA